MEEFEIRFSLDDARVTVPQRIFRLCGNTGYPPLFSEIKQEIDLTMAQLGMVIGVIPLASLIFAPLGGGLSDKLGARWVFGAGAILVAVAGGLRYFAGSVVHLHALHVLYRRRYSHLYHAHPQSCQHLVSSGRTG